MLRVLAVGAVALLLAGGVVLAGTTSPLTTTGTITAAGTSEAALVESFGERGSLILRYEHGETGAYAFTVRNDGPVGVTVTGIELPPSQERLLFQPSRVHLRTDGADRDWEPFALGPGGERTVVIEGRFAYCRFYTERALEVHDEVVVTYRIAGIPARQRLRLPNDVVVRSPTIQNCPDRVMDRSSNQRRDDAEAQSG